jgi:hypothetical protein
VSFLPSVLTRWGSRRSSTRCFLLPSSATTNIPVNHLMLNSSL